MHKVLTLAIWIKDGQMLLGMKKRGFGQGNWNGFGGKVEERETIEAATKREMQEECGVVVQVMEKVAINTFRFAHDERVLEVHIYLVTAATGEPVETEEMAPRWFPVDQIPLDAMWDDDKYWIDHFLSGQKFIGEFHFDTNSKVDEYSMKFVEAL